MAKKNKATLSAEKDVLFADNTAGDISALDLRNQTQDDIDSFLNTASGNPTQTVESDVNFTGVISKNGNPVIFGDLYTIVKSDGLSQNSTTTPLVKVSAAIPAAAPSGKYFVQSRAMFSLSNSSRDIILDLRANGVTVESFSEITSSSAAEIIPYNREYEIDHITGIDTDLDFRFWRGPQGVTISLTYAAIIFYRVSL